MSLSDDTDRLLEEAISENEALLECAGLDKYLFDPVFYERFLNDTANGANEISRTKGQPGYKTVESFEFQTGAYEYFAAHSGEMQREYHDRLVDRIDKDKVEAFFRTISEKWVDGRRNRCDSAEINSLKASIHNYLRTLSSSIYTREAPPKSATELLDPGEMAHLLHVTQQVTELFIEDYLEHRPDYPDNSLSRLYVHRGLSLTAELETDIFIDQGLLNSYSLFISVPEKFSQMCPDSIPAIVSTPFPETHNRILAFAPLIPGMPLDQLELVVVPSTKRMAIQSLGKHGGILEYEVVEERFVR